MTSKTDYLKKYLSTDDLGESKKEKKKKKRIKKGANLAIHDDDVDWRSLLPKHKLESEDEDDPDEAPLVAEFKDESVQKNTKWQPLAEDEDIDLSPPRRGRFDSPELSPPRSQNRNRPNPHSDDDLLPPRKKTKPSRSTRNMSPDLSPVRTTSRSRRVRHDSPDETLMKHTLYSEVVGRKRRQRHDSGDISPPRRTRHDSGDNSPPRRTRHDSGDISPPIRTRHDSGDISPPRRTRHDSGNISSPRRTRHDSGDISPPRRTRHDSGDNSPPRRTRHDSGDIIPPGKGARTRLSPDLSPPRKNNTVRDVSKSRDKMSSGARAGLQNAQALKEENALVRKKQEDYFKSLDPSVSGKHAETVYRDKRGRKVDPKLEKLQRKEKEKEMEEENEKFMTWGRGYVCFVNCYGIIQ